MKLRVTGFYTCGRFEVHPGDVVDFDEADAALLMGGGYAVEYAEVEKAVKPQGEKAVRPRKRKED